MSGYRYRETAFGLVYVESKALPVSSVFAAFFESLKIKREPVPQIVKKENLNQCPEL